MKKLLLITLIAISSFTAVNAARPSAGAGVVTGPVGPTFVHNYWGKFSYESATGGFSYIKIVGGNTLQACQQAYISAMGFYQTSPIWNFTGHILFCQPH